MSRGYFVLIVFLSFLQVAYSQTQIAGKVIEQSTNSPLEGVSIFIEGTTIGTISDLEGKFILKCEEGTYTIIAKYISYKNQTVKNIKVVKNQTTYLNFALEDDCKYERGRC
jgi:hypothetical protein